MRNCRGWKLNKLQGEDLHVIGTGAMHGLSSQVKVEERGIATHSSENSHTIILLDPDPDAGGNIILIQWNFGARVMEIMEKGRYEFTISWRRLAERESMASP